MFKQKQLHKFKDLKTESVNGKRHYVLPNGGLYPSITTILGWFKAKAIKEWREKVGEEEANKVAVQSSRRGTAVHQICEDFLSNKEDLYLKHMPNNVVMFKSIKPILERNIKVVHHQEVPLYSNKLSIAGRVDCICTWGDKPAIVDFKTSRKPKKEEWIQDYFEQCSAYSIMFEEMSGIHIPDIKIVMAVENNEPMVFEKKIYDYVPELLKKLETYKSYYEQKQQDKLLANAGSPF
ncbi:PD-(D/E)XK nuclease family protein [Hyphomonas sp.]|uniref:PD-(D/E)XK nuclease family protein n=1 Tax=Hyphomonas sp. TaxID=87 RepID=UPI000C934001|nr:PD-(D/E)XK nuclease family protein [Hyphomonas sp.]MAL46983.1 exonuclease [Hyphomonas sp.]|tara:strand:+ start:1575 stop:2282 length:708 start_codon:yes stop_codon:yes gene_type:complete